MKNVSRTKKMNSLVALVVMLAMLVTSIRVVPAKAEGTFTVVTSPCSVALNSYSYAKNYITVKDGDKVLTLNVDYNYGSDPLKATTTMITGNTGMWVWSGTVYGIGNYSGCEVPVSLFYTVTVSAALGNPSFSTTTQAAATTQQPAPTATAAENTGSSAATTQATTSNAGTEKRIEGEVTFKKFMEKYCNYGVYFTKDNKSYNYTIGKTANSGSLWGWYPCSPQYQYKTKLYKGVVGAWGDIKDSEGNPLGWDGNSDNMADMSLPARLWKKYTVDGEPDAINCMLDDFEKLPIVEKQLHISNYTYGQILKAAEKVGRTVPVEVLPVIKTSKNTSYNYDNDHNYSYNISVSKEGVQVYYCRQEMNSFLYSSNIASTLKSVNKVEVAWKCKGDREWRVGSRDPYYPGYAQSYATGYPMGKGNVYNAKGKQTNYWKNVTTIKVRQYRSINGKKYYTDWVVAYQNDGKTPATSSEKNIKTKVKIKTVSKGRKTKVKVAYTKKQKIKWKVSNTKVVKIVKKAGKGNNTITIKGRKVGKATITGKGKGKTFKIKVTVKKK